MVVHHSHRSARAVALRRSGFTLLELLAVVVIISLLVALLVPAVSTIRSGAKKTASQATLSALATGLEAMRADAKFGGQYPPSRADKDNRRVANPYRGQVYQGLPAEYEISGAGLLVWAMVGADRLGTPGFQRFKPLSQAWSDDTDNQFSNDVDRCGAYALYPEGHPKSGQAVRPRSQPYIELDKVEISPFNERLRRFVTDAELKARRGQPTPDRYYPMFLDKFGFPILYWKADPAGQRLADQNPANLSNPAQRGIYHWIDNGDLLTGNTALALRGGAGAHRLDWQDIEGRSSDDPPPPGYFPGYIRNNDVKAKLAPHRSDSYLLVSPGEDGLYGTADDITNFPHNGQ